MAVAACVRVQPAHAEAFWTQVQEDYQAVDYEGDPPQVTEHVGPLHFPAEAETLFEEVASLRYPFEVRYTAEDYLANLATQSGTHALGEARSAEFLTRVERRLESLGRPPLTVSFVALLAVGRRLP